MIVGKGCHKLTTTELFNYKTPTHAPFPQIGNPLVAFAPVSNTDAYQVLPNTKENASSNNIASNLPLIFVSLDPFWAFLGENYGHGTVYEKAYLIDHT
jgi:hypothetical protein